MNDLTPQEQQQLAEKKLKGTITPAEDALLEAWYAKDPGPQMFWESPDPDRKTLKSRVFFNIRKGAGIRGVHMLSGRRIGRLSVAASILAILGICGYLVNRSHSRPVEIPVAEKSVNQDVLPGHSGAILTLSDGSHIVLDSTGNGRIAIQGATHLVKNNGQLIYEVDGGTDQTTKYNTLTVPRGRQFSIVLPDGSMVWLNAASSLTYPTAFTGSDRKVEITGEAYFEVAKNPGLPFKVTINNATEVEVLGTHFNVSAYTDDDAIKTTLLEGMVRVRKGRETVRLSPGEQYKIDGSDGNSRIIKDVDVDAIVAWKNGFFQFDQTDIRTVMRQLARWYDVEVIYQGNVAERHFGGSISRNVNLSNVLKALEAIHVHCRIDGKNLILLP